MQCFQHFDFDFRYIAEIDGKDRKVAIEMDEGGLAEEIELLEAIYIEELEVQKNEKNEVDKITLQLHPSTGEDLEKRYVCMTLILGLSTQYPDVPPEIIIKNPRGIAEEEILSLREDMHKLCEERKGGPVLYELIELAKDSLTAGNIPHCPCMICLEHFHEGEKFTKTECYHYFHENCLMRYVSHVLTQTPEIVPVHSMPTPVANKLVFRKVARKFPLGKF
ncbi:E3 ubiquitin-protein ligase RNF25-like [Ruditapes philippinarum]|uniref:E3 ubiquitin-protein ligase RNF25-like n=1 Tax=Ruditapes philippinarum TaxID=129788 RepID=UPI00295B3830|nr:E3 ubiquitin-protein ligase RNF25-like [Ruditapes philippinarum]